MSSCAACGAPLQQAAQGPPAPLLLRCLPQGGIASAKPRSWEWVEANEPQAAPLSSWRTCTPPSTAPARRPRPIDSTPDHVAETSSPRVAVAAEFRRHGIAAAPQLGARCAAVASAIDAALAEDFGDVLKD